MITSKQCLQKFGDPNKYIPNLVVWDVPAELEVGFIPKKVYCNKLLIEPLTKAFRNLIERKFVGEIKTWDGCWCIRKMRGLPSWSLHSWAIAVDINASHNPLGKTVEQCKALGLTPFSEGFLQCFRDAGFECGGDWKGRPDRMHFQLASI